VLESKARPCALFTRPPWLRRGDPGSQPEASAVADDGTSISATKFKFGMTDLMELCVLNINSNLLNFLNSADGIKNL
jgi:hypothetical protein